MGNRKLAAMGWGALFLISTHFANAQAVSGDLYTCTIPETLDLTGDLYIECNGDLAIADKSAIITHGYAVTIMVAGILQMPSPENGGLKIIDGKSSAPVSDYIVIEATTAIGGLYIGSQSSPTEAAVELSFLTVYNFEQAIYSENALMFLDGKEVPLKGQANSLQ